MRSFVFAILLGLPLLASAQTPPLLAVLEFDAPEGVLTDQDLDVLTDAMRGAAKKEVGTKFKVMTRQTMYEIVPPEKMKCFAGKCVAEIGRMLQAPYVISGAVRKLGARKVLTVEAYESKGGQLLGSEQVEAKTAEDLLDALRGPSRGWVRAWLGLAPATPPAPKPDPVAPAKPKPVVSESKLGGGSTDFDLAGADELVATFESEPAGAVVLLDGKVLCKSAPCSKTVAGGRHQVTMSLEQYDDASSAVNLTRTSKSTRLVLSPAFGAVTVESAPAGLPVLIDGKLKGDAPVTERLDPGPHDVLVRDRCYAETGERIVVEKGKSRTVRIAPPEKLAGIKVSASDDAGNDVEAEVEVDGRKLGATPVTAKVPMCAKKVVVSANGASKEEALALKEKEVKPIAVVFAAKRAKPVASGMGKVPASSGGCPAGMVFIPGGTFDMGSKDGDSDEKPVHRVTVSSFCIDRTEHAESNGMPTVNVDWNRAKQICESEGKRLPTEAEWEFAARGTQGRKYPWGNSEPTCDKANYNECGGSAKRVGSLPAGATPEGVQDMAGNVWEWVADCYGSYSSSPQNNPSLEQNSCQGVRVLRGGGFDDGAAGVRSSLRGRNYPWLTVVDLGFRCARGTAR